MNPELLLTHFDRVSGAPEAIPRLRRFILDLAVRGKLVDQKSDDGSALALLAKETPPAVPGAIRKQEIEFVPKSRVPFGIPSNWIWVPLGDICSKTGSGSTPRGGKSVYQRVGVPFLRSQNVHDDGLRLDDVAYIDRQTHERMSGTAVQPGDLLLNITGGSIGRCCVIPKELGQANVSQHVAIIRVAVEEIEPYLHKLILSPYFQSFVLSEQTGAGRGGLPKNRMDRIPVALPPLAEQRRIVAKIDELIALCDQLEARERERETRRDQLVKATHHHLDNSRAPDALRKYGHFFIGYLPHLTVRPDQIEQLRLTILNLAVRGQVVPQNPNDEPTSELLKTIHTDKVRLIKDGKIKPQPPLPPIGLSQTPFRLPANWNWVRFGELITAADAGWSPKSESFPRLGDNWGVLKVSAVSWNKFLPEENKQLLPGVLPPEGAQVHAGDFLISRANTSELVAKCVVVEQEPHNLILSDKIVRLQISERCSKKFISIVNNHARHARAYYAEEASGTSLSMQNVSRAVIYQLPVPLPPLAEQHRIVAKVDELMGLCDQLEHQLTATQVRSRSLLESILYHALSNEQPKPSEQIAVQA
jgi:type I restriction enzyme S subunit